MLNFSKIQEILLKIIFIMVISFPILIIIVCIYFIFLKNNRKTNYINDCDKLGSNMYYVSRNGGECWRCKDGYIRTLEMIDSEKACYKKINDDELFEKAIYVSTIN